MIRTAALLWLSKDMTYPPALIEKAARYSVFWLMGHDDQRGASGPDFASIDATIAQIRAVNPRARIGLYVGGLAYKAEIDPPALWLTDADLLHRPNGSPLSWRDEVGVHSGGGVFTYKLPNIGSSAVQNKLIDGYVALVRQHQLDGILIDGYSPETYATYVANPAPSGMYASPTGCQEGAYHLAATWDAPLAAFGQRLRWRLEQVGAQLMLNGLDVGHSLDIVERGSGVLNEGFWACYAAPVANDWPDEVTRFRDLILQIQAVTARRRAIFLLASIGGYRLNNPATTILDSLALQRFYLGTYLLVQEPPYTSLGYHPHIPYRGWDGWNSTGGPVGNPYVFWSDDWDLDFGYPLTNCAIGDPATVAWRDYTRCLVVVNPTSQTQQMGYGGPYKLWHPVTGAVVASTNGLMSIPPKTAWCLFKVS